MKQLVQLSLLAALALPACQSSSSSGGDDDTDTCADADSDSDNDTAGTNMCPGEVQSFIWIANTGESTLSKVCTIAGEEVARYETCSSGECDPSRTSVNLHGDVVVTNRSPNFGASSVTKFAGDIAECVDRNDNNQIETSLGSSDVLPFGSDECMLWNAALGAMPETGARATAWCGEEDPETGVGGHVWVGTCTGWPDESKVYMLDGDTGEILEEIDIPLFCAYGGAVDGNGGFWVIDAMSIDLMRVDMNTLAIETYPLECGYGITVDAQGYVWTCGRYVAGDGGCISRFDPLSEQADWALTGVSDDPRGIAIGTEMSAGYVWIASTNGDLVQVDVGTLETVHHESIGPADMIGVAVDFEGYVWTVSEGGDTAYKINPGTWEITDVPIGSDPYTYSDMTGMQLKNVTPPE